MRGYRLYDGDGTGAGEVPLWLIVCLLVTSASSVWLALDIAVSRSTGVADPRFAAAGALLTAALIAVRGPRSVPMARLFIAVGAVTVVRRGAVSESLLDGDLKMLGWVVSTVLVLVVADRMTTTAREILVASRLGGTTGEPQANSSELATRPWSALRVGALTTLAVVALALVVWPLVIPLVSTEAAVGRGPRTPEADSAGTSLMASDRLDMTTRPDPTDEVMLRITTDRGMFWRGQVFDEWDGRHWTRSDPEWTYVGIDGQVATGFPERLAEGEVTTTQRVRVEATYTDIVFGAAVPRRVESPRPVIQHGDGTLLAAQGAMGRGATYTVESTTMELDEGRLRAAEGPVPDSVAERYAAEPEITPRVREAALAATADATTTYDKVRALERWMGERTEYSLAAPLAPEGVDVVDHFLFEARQGWCQQVASSLVVMARANGIPARLATGFVPGDRDAATGTYIVRAREYHAWTEVWFPEVGWVAFDPTASVPLAPPVENSKGLLDWVRNHALTVVLVVLVLLVVAIAGTYLARWLRRRRERLGAGPPTWAALADAKLTSEGERLGRMRDPSQTSATYATSLGEHLGNDRVQAVGRTVDLHLFSPTGPGAAAESEADQVLAELALLQPASDR